MKLSGKDKADIRLQVFLSHSGVCSRREALTLVQKGHVTVNGETVLEPSFKVNPAEDKVHVGRRLIRQKSYEYILLNKPKGCVTTKSDPFAEKTVLDLLPTKYRHLIPAGRLDKDTEGLLILTNDGDAAYQLTHPKFNVDKTYFVTIRGKLTSEEKNKLERGVVIEGHKTAPAKIKGIKESDGKTEFFMTIHEGKKRQIRLMLRSIRHHVLYLKRVSQGPVTLGSIQTGKWRPLTGSEISAIKKIAV